MPLDWEQESRAPTRSELAREAYEDWLADTYESRLADFCAVYRYDPEGWIAVAEYETYWNEVTEEDPYGGYGPPTT